MKVSGIIPKPEYLLRTLIELYSDQHQLKVDADIEVKEDETRNKPAVMAGS